MNQTLTFDAVPKFRCIDYCSVGCPYFENRNDDFWALFTNNAYCRKYNQTLRSFWGDIIVASSAH